MVRVALNGFGRIGKGIVRAAASRKDIDVVAINSRSNPEVYAHLLKYDSVHGRFPGDVQLKNGKLLVNGVEVHMTQEQDLSNLDWTQFSADVVVECTGAFKHRADLEKHVAAGARHVILSAPPKDDVPVIVFGVNDALLSKKPRLLSIGSCTTNCLAPIAKILDESFGIERGFLTTVHAYTGSQSLADASHKDLRRARAAAVNIIPTTTGAAKAVGSVLPHLKGKIDGLAVRVPVPNGSLCDFVFESRKPVTVTAINQAVKAAAASSLKNVLEYSVEPIVSSDVIGNAHSAVFDSLATTCLDDHFAKVLAWYDNETGVSHRILDVIQKLCGSGGNYVSPR